MAGTGSIAVVTGAGSGIGRAAALGLAAAGFIVVLAGRKLDALEATAALASDRSMLPVPTDVTDAKSVVALFETVRKQYGRVDLLFNNAGTGIPGLPLDQLAFEDLQRIVDVNLVGCLFCAREAMRLMKAQNPRGGRIINNGSISAYAPRPNAVGYTATKHAITGLTKSIIIDGRAFDITCGQIDVGNAATDMTERMVAGMPQANGTMEIEPRMNVQHVADAVVHMASLPLEANIPFLTVMASKMPLYGRG